MNVFVQVLALIAVLISMRTVDRWGRRPILLTGIAVMIVAQLVMVVTFATLQDGAVPDLAEVRGLRRVWR